MTAERRWQTTESWLFQYGSLVLGILQEPGYSEDAVWRAFEEVFAEAYRECPRIAARGQAAQWLCARALAWRNLMRKPEFRSGVPASSEDGLAGTGDPGAPPAHEAQDTAGGLPEASAEAPLPSAMDAAEDPFTPGTGEGDHGASTSETALEPTGNASACGGVPPLLCARTLQRLRAASAQLEAERKHRGPRWTAYAVTATVIVGLAAVMYGLYGPSGFPWLGRIGGAAGVQQPADHASP